MGNWYLVRHGETEWNREGRIQGQMDVPLSEFGRRQVSMLAKRLAECEFSAVYASDLSRTNETAEIIVSGREISVTTNADLREFSYGDREGKTREEIRAQDLGRLAEPVKPENNRSAAHGGESTAQMLDRVSRFCANTQRLHDVDEDILVVAHGGSLRVLLVCLLDLPIELSWRFRLDCASLSVVSNPTGARVLSLWNDTGHLASMT